MQLGCLDSAHLRAAHTLPTLQAVSVPPQKTCRNPTHLRAGLAPLMNFMKLETLQDSARYAFADICWCVCCTLGWTTLVHPLSLLPQTVLHNRVRTHCCCFLRGHSQAQPQLSLTNTTITLTGSSSASCIMSCISKLVEFCRVAWPVSVCRRACVSACNELTRVHANACLHSALYTPHPQAYT